MKIVEIHIRKIYSVKELKPQQDIPINFVLYELVVDTDKEKRITITVDETDYKMIKEKRYYTIKKSNWERE